MCDTVNKQKILAEIIRYSNSKIIKMWLAKYDEVKTVEMMEKVNKKC